MTKHFCLSLFVVCLFVFGQAPQDVRPLEPGQSLEREMAGGESHTYQLTLTAGQFMRVVVEQKGIDVALVLIAPDGKQVAEVNLSTGAGGLESLSHEAVVSGDYRVVVRPIVATAPKGAYQVRVEAKAVATAQDKQRIAAERLLAEATRLSQPGAGAGAVEQIIEKAQQALPVWRALGDRYWEGSTLNRIGTAYFAAQKYAQAIESFNQALAIRREAKDRWGEGNTLFNLGITYNGLRRYEKAIEYFESALQIIREAKFDRQGERIRLNMLGSAYRSLGHPEKIIEYYDQGLASSREIKDRPGEANMLDGLGTVYASLGRYEKAIEYHEQALAIYRELKDRVGEANMLGNLGNVYSAMYGYEKAMAYYEQALAIFRELKDRRSEASALFSLGNASQSLSRLEKAIEYFEQVLAIARETKSRRGEMDSLINLGTVYSSLGRQEKAIEYQEQALLIARELKDRGGEGSALVNLGNVYHKLSRYEKAIEYQEQALVIFRELKAPGEGVAIINLGGLYSALGRYEKAIEYYEQALTLFRELKSWSREVTTLIALGGAYRLLGRYEKATDYTEQALAISREVKSRSREGDALSGLGRVSYSMRRYEQAFGYYEQSLAIYREVKSRRDEGGALATLGNAWQELGQPDKATSFHEQALLIAREVKARGFEAAALNSLMLDWKARHQPRLAIFFGKQSVNVYQEIRSTLRALDQETQQSFLKSKEDKYRELADVLISEGRLPEAEQVIRMLKQEEYFEFIRRDQSNAPQADKAQLTPEEAVLEKRDREIADQLATLGSERGTLVDKKSRTPEEEQRLAKLDADLVVAGNAFQKFLDQLVTELSHSKEASSKILKLNNSQALMEDLRELGKGVVALYTLVGENKYRIILTTPDFQKGYEYPIKAADLNRKVLEFREVLQNPKLDPLPLAQELYKILVGPVAKDLKAAKAQTLMWSLDGVLRYVPMAALHDGKQYLVEQYRNAVFTLDSNARLKDLPSNHWHALGLGVTKAHGERIPALPGVTEEMHGIIREEASGNEAHTQGGVLPGTIKLDEAFTQEAMLAGLRQRPPVVHVASHFQFQPGDETNSALLLGDGSFLSLAQIKNMSNVFGGVELLTLSACNTATGGSGANGKEIEGFGMLAQSKGAKAVVASLWPVFDTSTKELMQDFYRLREARAGTSKAEALRQAQLKLLRGEATTEVVTTKAKDRQIVHEEKPDAANKPRFTPDPKKPYAHPYYWAPFILIGNWR